jgi:hypothetical protein
MRRAFFTPPADTAAIYAFIAIICDVERFSPAAAAEAADDIAAMPPLMFHAAFDTPLIDFRRYFLFSDFCRFYAIVASSFAAEDAAVFQPGCIADFAAAALSLLADRAPLARYFHLAALSPLRSLAAFAAIFTPLSR